MTINVLSVQIAVDESTGDEPFLLICARVFVDRRPVIDRGTIDLRELVASANRDGDHWIFTCGCGCPGHACIEAPVHVLHGVHRVWWALPDRFDAREKRQPPDEYSIVIDREYEFDRVAYLATIGEALTVAKGLARFPGISACMGLHGFEIADLFSIEVPDVRK